MRFKKQQNYLICFTLLFSIPVQNVVQSQSFATHKTLISTKLLSHILQELKEEKQVTFLYEPETIKGVLVENDFNKNDDIKIILKNILPPVGLKFRKVGKYNYVIKKNRDYHKNGLGKINQKPGQPYLKQKTKTPISQQISGVIKSEENEETLIGATIRIKGTGIGTITDENGQYDLPLPPGSQTLVFSYLGFEDKEVKINGPTQQNILMKPAATDLSEVIVTAIGLESNKRLLGYAADNIPMDNLPQSNGPNLVSLLSAQSAGVWVNSASGSPGTSASIFIRGLRSVNGSNKPLFILDGMPVDNTTTGNTTGSVDVSNRLIDLNQNDIEKITILKGAAATALYGIRAANGAVVMTSKRGGKGKPKISFSSSYGFSEVNKLPPIQTQYAQGKYANGQAVFNGPETGTSSSFGPLVSELEFDGDASYPYDQNGHLVPKGQGNGQPANVYNAYKTLFIKGQTLDNHLSISGGANWFDYLFSFGQFRETGVVPSSTFERYSLRGAFQVRLQRNLQVGMSTNLIRSGGYRMKRGSLFSGIPLGLFRNPVTFDIGNGRSGKAAANSPDTYIFENGEQRGYRGNGRFDNPFWTINHNQFEDQVNRLIQHVNVDYQLATWLKASYRIGIDTYTDDRHSAYDINSGSHRNGQVEVSDIQSTNLNSDFLLMLEKQVSNDWHLSATLGHNFFSSQFSIKETIGEGLEKQGIYNISNSLYITTNESLLRKKVAGLFADVQLRFKNILYLNLTGRNDWSSALPKRNNAFFYPSLNAGFEFSELLGWTGSPFLSFGKLRFSLSQVGNDAGTYLTDTYFVPAVINGDDLLPNVGFPAFGVSAFERSSTLGNPNLKPENTTTIELGTDLKFFKGRLQLDCTWYKAVQQDQIINTQVSATSGYLNAPINAGTVENQGVELSLQINPIRQKQFSWDVSANFSKFKSIVTELPESTPGIVLASFTNLSSMILEGKPYGMFVGTSFKRDEAGRKIIGSDGFPMVNETQTIVGDPNPDWLLGLRNTWQWKRFSLSALLDIRRGGDIWNGTRGVMSHLGVSKISGDQREVKDYVFDGVTETGEPNTQPVDLANPANGMSGIYWRRYGFLGLAEEHVEDGSWVRLRELRLSYQFSPKWLKGKQPDIIVSVSGHNVFLITKYSGIDPETNLRGDSNILGWDYFTLPSTRGWNLQMKAIF